MESKYKGYRIIDGKARWVIITENGEIINRNPTKEELKGIKKEIRIPYDTAKWHGFCYTDDELLEYLRQFYNENERPPTMEDFTNNHRCPLYVTYQNHFGSWSNALKLA